MPTMYIGLDVDAKGVDVASTHDGEHTDLPPKVKISRCFAGLGPQERRPNRAIKA